MADRIIKRITKKTKDTLPKTVFKDITQGLSVRTKQQGVLGRENEIYLLYGNCVLTLLTTVTFHRAQNK